VGIGAGVLLIGALMALFLWGSDANTPGRAPNAAADGLYLVAFIGLAIWLILRRQRNKKRLTSVAYIVSSTIVAAIALGLGIWAYSAPTIARRDEAGSVQISLHGSLSGTAQYLGDWAANPDATIVSTTWPETYVEVDLKPESSRPGFYVSLQLASGDRVVCESEKRVNWSSSPQVLSFTAHCDSFIPIQKLQRLMSVELSTERPTQG
jgi:hypothetical protein